MCLCKLPRARKWQQRLLCWCHLRQALLPQDWNCTSLSFSTEQQLFHPTRLSGPGYVSTVTNVVWWKHHQRKCLINSNRVLCYPLSLPGWKMIPFQQWSAEKIIKTFYYRSSAPSLFSCWLSREENRLRTVIYFFFIVHSQFYVGFNNMNYYWATSVREHCPGKISFYWLLFRLNQ